MFRNVPECFGMFHVPGFIDGPSSVPKSKTETKHRRDGRQTTAIHEFHAVLQEPNLSSQVPVNKTANMLTKWPSKNSSKYHPMSALFRTFYFLSASNPRSKSAIGIVRHDLKKDPLAPAG